MNTSIHTCLLPAYLLTAVATVTTITLRSQAARSRHHAVETQVAQLHSQRAQKLETAKAPLSPQAAVPESSLPKCVGMVKLLSSGGGYLQCYTNGSIHASNKKQNEEETWFLYLVDADKGEYALRNWRTGMFLSRDEDTGHTFGDAIGIGPAERWILEDGVKYHVSGVWAIRASQSGAYLGANSPGKDVERLPADNGRALGEVAAMDCQKPWNTAHWSGYWRLEAVHTPPQPGRDFWNSASSVLEVAGKEIWVKLSGVDLAALLGA